MKIQSKLILVFGAMTLAVSVLFSAIAFQRLKQNASRNAANINALIRSNLERQIWEKARDIAGQVEIYLADHPFDPRDEKLRRIAVQPVLKTGYSGLHDGVGSGDGRYVFHTNSVVEGKVLSDFKAKLPDLWRAIAINLRGAETSAYYLWEGL